MQKNILHIPLVANTKYVAKRVVKSHFSFLKINLGAKGIAWP